MKRTAAIVVLLALLSCNGGPNEQSAPTTGSTASTASTSTTAAPTTTAAPVLIQDCSAPPTTFSVLCETVERILEQHYQPPDLAAMAVGALEGVLAASPEASSEPAGRLTCAVPTPDFNPTCEAIDAKVHADGAPLEPMVTAAVDGVLSILDPYNIYLPPSIADVVGDEGGVAGVGVIIGALNAAGSPCVRVAPSCPLTVATVVAGSAAANAGVVVGDTVVNIDGQPVEGFAVAEVAALLTGEPGSMVSVGLADRTVSITRVDDRQVAVSGEMVGDTAYVRLSYFEIETHLLLHDYLDLLIDAGANRIVLDLRDNPGGYLFSASLVGSEFIDNGDLYLTQDRAGVLRYPAVEGGIATRIPLLVVVNEHTASAAEILAAALQERDRATIVGVPTFGKNLVQVPFPLRNGGVLRLTIGTWTTPDGFSVAETGVVPEVALTLDPASTPTATVEAALAVAG